jgi:Skp family chaperone for outer membrane proteins
MIELQELEDQFAEEQATVSELRTELEEIFSNININAVTMTETEIQRLTEEGQFKQLRIQQIGERVQTSLRETQNNFLERYRQLIGDAINEIYEQGAYDFILRSESVVVSGFSFDVTPNVTAKLNELIASTRQ